MVGPQLLKLINESLEVGSVPDAWKVSTIVPVPKVTGTHKASEMRPINMLPIVEKMLEEIVMIQLKEFISINDCLVVEQSGLEE
jgi:hypothetical protein